MGMGEEMLSEMEAIYYAEESQREGLAKNIVENYKMGICFWQTKNKEKINVAKMTDNHLINTIKLLNKNIDLLCDLTSITTRAWLKVLNAEKLKREI